MYTDTPMLTAILLFLLLLSVLSWTVLGVKVWLLAREHKRSTRFAAQCWQQGQWSAMRPATPQLMADFAKLVAAGQNAIQSVLNYPAGPNRQQHQFMMIQRTLEQQAQQLLRQKEAGLWALASIAAIAPLVGLFGTVWGIMNALIAISQSGDATLPVVAGPIGEALTSTAAGILVAIPAALSYNYLLRKIRLHATQLDQYIELFTRALPLHPDLNPREGES